MHKLIIIGSGPAGLTAAIYASRANLAPVVIEGKEPGGQLMGTTYIENWPGNRSILGPELMHNMRKHAQDLGTTFVSGNVINVNFRQSPFTIETSKTSLTAEAVIIATGAMPKRLNIPGEDTYWGKGVSTCAVCDGAFYKDKKVVIVGGGDTAMEDASFLTKFTSDITIIQLLDKLTASAAMQDRVLKNPVIKIIYSTAVTGIEGSQGHVTQVLATNKETGKSLKLEADGIFLAIGLTPVTQLFKDQLELTPYGYIKVYDQTKTSIPGIFVAGDVADNRYRQAITSAGAGCMAALDAERYLNH